MQPVPMAKQPRISPLTPCSCRTVRTVETTPGGTSLSATGAACIRVLTVSIGYIATCSIMPAQLPATACCQKGVLPSHSSHSNDSKDSALTVAVFPDSPTRQPASLSVWMHPEGPERLPTVKCLSSIRMDSYVPQHIAAEGISFATRGPSPRKNPRGPSSFAMTLIVDAIPSYLAPAWVWRRVFTTSKGSVSVEANAPEIPAERKYNGAPEKC
mmetsp:Transcript_9376/g.22093  ORF Transcript_9376/g.22093 Transcript_9376/m.22093 type:complete len:213 (-) Transcript_9376:661-1299(-)